MVAKSVLFVRGGKGPGEGVRIGEKICSGDCLFDIGLIHWGE